jgi:hypothetical protein
MLLDQSQIMPTSTSMPSTPSTPPLPSHADGLSHHQNSSMLLDQSKIMPTSTPLNQSIASLSTIYNEEEKQHEDPIRLMNQNIIDQQEAESFVSSLEEDRDGGTFQLQLNNDIDDIPTNTIQSQIVAYNSQHNQSYINFSVGAFCAMKEVSPRERRPLMSLATECLTKDQVTELLKIHISKREWRLARKHALFPGAGKPLPPKPVFFRKRLDDEIVSEFVQWLHASNYLQNLSFGHKVVQYCNGIHTAIEAVKLTKNMTTITRDYADMWLREHSSSVENDAELGNINIEDDDSRIGVNIYGEDNAYRCTAICRKSRLQCFLSKDHERGHKFTPKSRLSSSSIANILQQLTAGKIRSLAGLDDTDEEKGRLNFLSMKALIRTLSAAGMYGQNGCPEADELIEKIEKVQEFHKIGFPRHLGNSTSRHICTCLSCGFHGEGTDHVECKLRQSGEHSGPCGECADGFKLFEDIFKLHDNTKRRLNELSLLENDPILQDDMESWYQDIHLSLGNFLDYRRHIAQAEDESLHDREFYKDLKENEAVVVMDFKMKILASMYREKQKDWYSKRGFSCLGALIIFGSSKDSNENEVLYHFFCLMIRLKMEITSIQ